MEAATRSRRRRVSLARVRAARLAPVALGVGLLAVGCGGETPGSGDAATLDLLPSISLVEELRIGSLDDPLQGFSNLGTTLRVAEGDTIWVPEQSVPEIRVYAPDGRLVRRIGRRGDGPGELLGVSLWGLLGDTLWVTDFRRITLFRRDGSVIRTVPAQGVRIQAEPYFVTVQPVMPLPEGGFQGQLTSWGPFRSASDPRVVVQVPLLVFDENGAPVDTLGFHELTIDPSGAARRDVGGVTLFRGEYPPARELLQMAGEDSVWVHRPPPSTAEAGTVTVVRVTSRGDTAWRRELRFTPRPVEAAFRDSVLSARLEPSLRRTSEPAAVERAVRELTVFHPFYPGAADVTVTEDGSIWLRREPSEPGSWRWTLLAPDGRVRGELATPPGTSILWSDGERVYLGERDAFDVPWLVRYRLRGG